MIPLVVLVLSCAALIGCSNRQVSTVPVANVTVTPSPKATTAAEIGAFVTDEQAAVDIALETWFPVYGRETIDNEKPYIAELKKWRLACSWLTTQGFGWWCG